MVVSFLQTGSAYFSFFCLIRYRVRLGFFLAGLFYFVGVDWRDGMGSLWEKGAGKRVLPSGVAGMVGLLFVRSLD